MIDLQLLQRVMDERGYLVMGSNKPFAIGEVLQEIERPSLISGPFMILGSTDRADMLAQQSAMNIPPPEGTTRWPYYYRVLAE